MSDRKLTIGIPIYNGEKFIRQKFENILSQTFQDFELIISDDSTDSTPEICKEFAVKDNRIRHIHQPIRKGWRWNYVFLAKQANTKYFVWTNVDDLWTNDFLSENIKILEKNKNIVASMGKVDQFDDSGIIKDQFEINTNDSIITRSYKKFRKKFRPFTIKPLSGKYDEKVRKFLKTQSPLMGLSIFRTESLKNAIQDLDLHSEWELSYEINLLKYGDTHVIDKVMVHFYMQGLSVDAILTWKNNKEMKFFDLVFPSYSLMKWFIKKMGLKLFVKNLDHFIWLMIYGRIAVGVALVKNIIRLLKKKDD